MLIGVVQGISPTLEEASQTLRAKRWTTFRTVTLPLMRPGLANAFLLGFVESMADFGNPLVLGGNFEVLSTKIFFAVVGAAHGPGPRGRAVDRAARLHARRLLGAAGLARQEGLHDRHRQGRCRPAAAAAAARRVGLLSRSRCPWALFTFAIYAIILVGGFVQARGARLHADARALSSRRSAIETQRRAAVLLRRGLGFVLRDREVARYRRPAHGRDRPAHRLSADAPALRRPRAFEFGTHAELRHPRHRRRRRLHPRLQRAADRDHRHGARSS